jgi:predicted Ser/Thr protein kinase
MAEASTANNPRAPEEGREVSEERRSTSFPEELDAAGDAISNEMSAGTGVSEEARATDPAAVADEELVFSAERRAEDSAPPSIPSAADVRSAPPSPSPGGAAVLPGHVIANRYEVLGVLGEGGMGIVYRCRDRSNAQIVALKRVIPPPGNLANEYLMWFYKEARALAALDHPNIVKAKDFGQLRDGSPYLAMELVHGVSLHDLAHTRVTFPLVWAITDRILDALAHAHARGIIHGDLKPSNVLVERRDEEPPDVHVLDFGLAWLRQDWHDERLDGSKAMEFAPHAGAGTPGYMAPEQIQHEMLRPVSTDRRPRSVRG